MDHHIMIWAWVFEWIPPSWVEAASIQEYLQYFFPPVCYDEVYTTLGSLGQIFIDHQLPLNDIILAASYVCLDLIWLIHHVYRVYRNLQGHPDIDEGL